MERERERDRDRERRDEHHQDYKERERDCEITTTPVDISNKRRRKNSSNCDNSLTSTHSANVQERHYSQDSQVNKTNFQLFTKNIIRTTNNSEYKLLLS